MPKAPLKATIDSKIATIQSAQRAELLLKLFPDWPDDRRGAPHRLGLSKNTVLDIVKRDRLKMPALSPIVGHEILLICEPAPKGRSRRSP